MQIEKADSRGHNNPPVLHHPIPLVFTLPRQFEWLDLDKPNWLARCGPLRQYIPEASPVEQWNDMDDLAEECPVWPSMDDGSKWIWLGRPDSTPVEQYMG